MGGGASKGDLDLFNIGMNVATEKEKISHGLTRYANGDTYEGKWRFDQKHGRGKYIYCQGSPEGILYDGQWKHNVKHGKGTFYYRNGDSKYCSCFHIPHTLPSVCCTYHTS